MSEYGRYVRYPYGAPPRANGEIRWSVPTGREDGIDGLVNFGPPLVTAGGLVFHAGTRELVLRAHDIATG
jgi:quinoprotein glucose dehydrogenase